MFLYQELFQSHHLEQLNSQDFSKMEIRRVWFYSAWISSLQGSSTSFGIFRGHGRDLLKDLSWKFRHPGWASPCDQAQLNRGMRLVAFRCQPSQLGRTYFQKTLRASRVCVGGVSIPHTDEGDGSPTHSQSPGYLTSYHSYILAGQLPVHVPRAAEASKWMIWTVEVGTGAA